MIDSAANTTTAYTYDMVNRLAQAHAVATGTTTQTSDYQYGYDANGNRISTTIGGSGTTATFNEVDEQLTWNTGLTRTYSYDGNGNETGSSAGESRTYNSRNQTVSITGLNGTLTPIGYLDGGQGERTDAGGSHYVNSSLGVGSETKSGSTTYYTRTPGGHLVSQRTPGGSYYYLYDGLGSVVGMVDPYGNLVARYGYDPYGQTVTKHGPDSNPTYLTIADGNPFRYTGAYLDSTGLYKMGERYYDPARGRFTQLDPLGNGYVYASDNPVNLTDPSGLCNEEECNPSPGQPEDDQGPVLGPPTPKNLPPENLPDPGNTGDPVDPNDPPAPGWTWGGPNPPTVGRGNWVGPGGDGRLNPDPKGHPNPPAPPGPHWDWTDPDGNRWWIDWPGGRVTPKLK